jgi:hypothetical protein
MRSAPAILILIAMVLMYGSVMGVVRGQFSIAGAITLTVMLPVPLLISAVQIWRAQHGRRTPHGD